MKWAGYVERAKYMFKILKEKDCLEDVIVDGRTVLERIEAVISIPVSHLCCPVFEPQAGHWQATFLCWSRFRVNDVLSLHVKDFDWFLSWFRLGNTQNGNSGFVDGNPGEMSSNIIRRTYEDVIERISKE